jgi:hypothetical protein
VRVEKGLGLGFVQVWIAGSCGVLRQTASSQYGPFFLPGKIIVIFSYLGLVFFLVCDAMISSV